MSTRRASVAGLQQRAVWTSFGRLAALRRPLRRVGAAVERLSRRTESRALLQWRGRHAFCKAQYLRRLFPEHAVVALQEVRQNEQQVPVRLGWRGPCCLHVSAGRSHVPHSRPGPEDVVQMLQPAILL